MPTARQDDGWGSGSGWGLGDASGSQCMQVMVPTPEQLPETESGLLGSEIRKENGVLLSNMEDESFLQSRRFIAGVSLTQ